MTEHDITCLITGKGATAQLREILAHCTNRETIRVLYTEMRRITAEMARKHQFPAEARQEKKAA